MTRHELRAMHRHSGATAVEFAMIFPLMFAVMYCAIVYSFTYTLKQSITFAAQEAAEAAVDIQPSAANYDTLVTTAAKATASSIILWMPSNIRSGVTTNVSFCPNGGGSPPCPTVGSAVVVTITLPLTGSNQLFASFTMPLIGTFPPLPATMTAQAVARV